MVEAQSALVGVDGVFDSFLGGCSVVPALHFHPLAGLQSLVVLEEVTNLVAQQFRQVFDFTNVVVGLGQLVVRHGHQFGITAGFVFHVQYAYRATANHRASLYRVGGNHQYVQRVAIVGQGVGDEAVVGRVEHRGGHEAVNQQGAHVFVQFVLDRGAVGRDFDGNVDVFWRVLASGDVVELHVRSFLVR